MAFAKKLNKCILHCTRNNHILSSKLPSVPFAFSKQLLTENLKMSHLLHTTSSSIRHASHYHTLVSRVINTHIYRPHFCGQRIFTTSCLRLANKPGTGRLKAQGNIKTTTQQTGKTKASKLDVKRLLSLARPERWKLAGMIIV